jgi:RNA 2',3'-cyclic 3'-phosphodiesterase
VRLFIAADLDERARAALAGSIGQLRAHVESAGVSHPHAVKWVDARQLHLTLHFLGEIDDRRLPAIVGALGDPLPMAPVDVALGGWGVFPPRGAPRVIWAGVTAGTAGLSTAHRLLRDRLQALGLRLEPRPLSPHLTVGRVKDPVGSALTAAVAAAAPPAAVTCRIDHCTMYQSRLSPSGPTYLAQAQTRWHP